MKGIREKPVCFILVKNKLKMILCSLANSFHFSVFISYSWNVPHFSTTNSKNNGEFSIVLSINFIKDLKTFKHSFPMNYHGLQWFIVNWQRLLIFIIEWREKKTCVNFAKKIAGVVKFESGTTMVLRSYHSYQKSSHMWFYLTESNWEDLYPPSFLNFTSCNITNVCVYVKNLFFHIFIVWLQFPFILGYCWFSVMETGVASVNLHFEIAIQNLNQFLNSA